MKNKILTATIALILLTTTAALAQPGMRTDCFGNPQCVHPEARKYFKENILPVIKIQRHELDASITEADKERIEVLRKELKALRNQHFEKRKPFRQAEERPSIEQRREMRAIRDEMHELMREAEEMADVYHDVIVEKLDALRKQSREWQNEMQQKFDCGNRRPAERPGRGFGYGKRNFHGNSPGNMVFKWLRTPEGFLLWDPDEPLPFQENALLTDDDTEIGLFPNPASESVQVTVQLDEETSVSIALMDKNGNALKTTKPEKVSEGIFTQNFDIGDLDNGIYFVKVKMEDKIRVERLIIQH